MSLTQPSEEEIKVAAFILYVNGGYKHGRDKEDWFAAQAALGHPKATPGAMMPPLNINQTEEPVSLPTTQYPKRFESTSSHRSERTRPKGPRHQPSKRRH